MAKAENTKPFANKIQSDRKNVIGEGFFKDTGHGEMGRALHDVRSASFHPIDPALACGLFHGGLVFLRGSSHATSFENWEIEPKKCPYDKAILSIQWNVNGTKVAAGSDDGAVIVWCYPGKDKQVFRRQGRSNFPLIVWNPFNRDVLASYNKGIDTTQVLICNSDSEKPHSHIIKSNSNYCDTAAWISYNLLACGYVNGTIEVHEIKLHTKKSKNRIIHKFKHDQGDGKMLFSLDMLHSQNRSDVKCIVWNEELNLLASGGIDIQPTVKIWSSGSSDPIHVLKVDSDCECLVWNTNGNGNETKEEIKQKTSIACGLQEGSIVIWYPFESQNQTRKLKGHSFQSHQLLFSPDGRYLASTDLSKKLIIWSTKNWKSIYILPSSEFMYPYAMTWDASSSKIGISERKGQKKFKVIEYVVIAENCCAACKKESENLKRCSRCRSICYCSVECQRLHWPQHKTVCPK